MPWPPRCWTDACPGRASACAPRCRRHDGGSLSIDEARRVALARPGPARPAPARRRAAMLRRLGARAARHHFRAGPIARAGGLRPPRRRSAAPRIERAYWGPRSATFEYWSHAACVLPLEEWPTYAFKRRARRAKGGAGTSSRTRRRAAPRSTARLRAEGPLTAKELGGAKSGGPWWDWSEIKIAAEWLLDTGELVCRQRRGFQRVYDLADRAIPAELRGAGPTDERVRHAAWSRRPGVPSAWPRWATWPCTTGCRTGRSAACWRHRPGAGRRSRGGGGRPSPIPTPSSPRSPVRRGRTVLLSPFDSLMLVPARIERLFGLRHRLEAYTPRAQAAVRLLRHAGAGRHRDRRAWSTRAVGTGRWWPSRSRCSAARRRRAGRRGAARRRRAGWAATPSSLERVGAGRSRTAEIEAALPPGPIE